MVNIALSSLSAVVFLLIIFFTITVITKKYRDIAGVFGVKIEDDCQLKQGLVRCGYIKLSGRDFDINLTGVEGSFDLKALFNTNPVLTLYVNRADVVYINDLKAPPSPKIKGMFEGYLFLNYSSLNINTLNVKVVNLEENIDLYAKAVGVRNKNNVLYLFSLNLTVISDDERFEIKVLNPEKSRITVNPSKIILKNISTGYQQKYLTIYDGVVQDNKRVLLNGDVFLDSLGYKNVKLDNVKSQFRFVFQPEKMLDLKSEGSVGEANVLDFPVWFKNTAFSIDLYGKDTNNFKLKGYLKTADGYLNHKQVGRIEFNYKLAKDDKKLYLDGSVKSDVAEIKLNLQDSNLSIKTGEVYLSKIKHFIDIPVKDIDGTFLAKADIDISKWDGYFDFDIKRFQLYGLKNLEGKARLRYLKDRDLVELNSSLVERGSSFELNGYVENITREPNLNINIGIKNLKLETIPELKEIKIYGEADITGKVYGSFDSIKTDLTGYAKTFGFEEISIKDIDFKLTGQGGLLNINANLKNKTLFADVSLDLDRGQTSIGLRADRFMTEGLKDYLVKHSDIFSNINIGSITGKVDIQTVKDNFRLNLNLRDTFLSFLNSSPLNVAVSGYISGKDVFIKIDGYSDRFNVEGQSFENFYLKTTIKNSDVNYSISSDYLAGKEKLSVYSTGSYNTDTEKLKAELKADGKVMVKDKVEDAVLTGSVYGTLNNLQGEGSFGLGKAKTSFRLKASSVSKGSWVGHLNILPFSYQLNGGRVELEGVEGSFDFNPENPDSFKGSVKLINLSFLQRNINIVSIKEVNLNLNKDRVYTLPIVVDGVVRGKIETLDYNLKKDQIKIFANGEVDKKYLSEISQFINIDGSLRFSLSYNGDVSKVIENYQLKIYGDNLRLRTPYTQNIVSFKKFDIAVKDQLYMGLEGTTRSAVGDGVITVSGTAKPDFSNLNINITSSKMPVKYSNQFSGILDGRANFNLSDKNLKINIDSQITGRAKVEPEMFETRRTENGIPELIKKAKLDIAVSTSSPVFVEGSWGRAYAEGQLNIGGTVEKPVLDGKIRITYGKIVVMKNIYNIDFLNINITNNSVYINGRLSTVASGVNIFVNVSGISNNLKYDFYSTPPKSKDEILTLLLLKKTPEQIASSGLFGVIGKVGEMLMPFKVEEEERGLFGTGVNVNIVPSYSPVQGIVFSVYMQKYLTRRIYIGLSRPLSQYQLTNYVGWYEGGIRLTERTSFVIKSFENKSKSAEITFTLPFDF